MCLNPMLPYQYVHEAQASLARDLTFPETIWFNYSANKSDDFLYCHNNIFLFLIFSVVPLFIVLLEVRRFDGLGKYKIQPKVRLSFHDVFRCFMIYVV